MEASVGGGPSIGGGQGKRAGEILDAAVKLYSARAVDLWKIASVVVVPTVIVSVILSRLSLPSQIFAHDGKIYYYPGESISPLGVAGSAILAGIANLVAVGALFRCMLETHAGRRSGWRESLSFAFSRAGSLVVLAILTGLGVGVASIALIIPGVYLYVCWCVAVPVLMFEGVKGTKALSRSRELVSGRWWSTFGVLLAGTIVSVIIYVILSTVLAGAVDGSISSVMPILIVRGLFLAIAQILTFPVTAAVVAMIYIDLRTRKEAFDLELYAGWLNTGGPGAAVPAAASPGPVADAGAFADAGFVPGPSSVAGAGLPTPPASTTDTSGSVPPPGG